MSNSFYDIFAILFLIVIPIIFLLLHTFLSSRKRLVWSAIVPSLWTILGAWIIIAGYVRDMEVSIELIIFFLAGDLILIGITALIRAMKKKRK